MTRVRIITRLRSEADAHAALERGAEISPETSHHGIYSPAVAIEEKTMNKPLCIYHGNCADGFTAAWAVWKAFGDAFDFHPGIYQNPPPDVRGRDVVMVDFSYKRPVIEAMAKEAKSILVLDHHKSAESDLAPFTDSFRVVREEWRLYRDGIQPPRPVAAVFDMAKSGALLAWEFFNPSGAVPELVKYVSDRDLWQFKMPGSREVNAYIFSHEYTFRNWDYLHAMLSDHMSVQLCIDMGGAIEKKHHKDVAELVGALKRKMVIGGYEVPAANIPYVFTSDAGHLMAQGQPFAACYWDTAEGRVFSLRSTDAGLDVAEIAKLYGGGGHRNASGFRMPLGWNGDQ